MSSDAPDPPWGEPGKQQKKTPTRRGTSLPHAPGPGLSGLVPGRPAHAGQHRAAGSSASGLATSPRVCRRFETENSPVLQTAGFLSPAAASDFSVFILSLHRPSPSFPGAQAGHSAGLCSRERTKGQGTHADAPGHGAQGRAGVRCPRGSPAGRPGRGPAGRCRATGQCGPEEPDFLVF